MTIEVRKEEEKRIKGRKKNERWDASQKRLEGNRPSLLPQLLSVSFFLHTTYSYLPSFPSLPSRPLSSLPSLPFLYPYSHPFSPSLFSPSMSLAPVFLVLAALSLPARSTRESLPTYDIIYKTANIDILASNPHKSNEFYGWYLIILVKDRLEYYLAGLYGCVRETKNPLFSSKFCHILGQKITEFHEKRSFFGLSNTPYWSHQEQLNCFFTFIWPTTPLAWSLHSTTT